MCRRLLVLVSESGVPRPMPGITPHPSSSFAILGDKSSSSASFSTFQMSFVRMRTRIWYVSWLVWDGWVCCGRCRVSMEGDGLKHRRRGSPRPYGKTTVQGLCIPCLCLCGRVCLDMDGGVRQRCLKGNKRAVGLDLTRGGWLCFECREEGARPYA